MMANEETEMVCAHCGLPPAYPGVMRPECVGYALITRELYVRSPNEMPRYEIPKKKPYEAPKVSDADFPTIILFSRILLRKYFEASPKTSFGLGDIYEGIDKVLLGK